MSFTVDENYDGKTLLSDFYLIIKSNIQKIADLINRQQAEIKNMDCILGNIDDVILAQMPSKIENNKNDIYKLIRAADIIIATEPEGISERLIFQKVIPGVKYCAFLGNTALTNTAIDMTEATAAEMGVYENDKINIKFYAFDGCELASGTLNVVSIFGVKTAYISFCEGLVTYNNKWLDAKTSALTWGGASRFTWRTIKNHKT